MNDTLINIILALGAALTGYLFGGIPSGVIIGKLFFKKDPRDFGSHNSGGTNSGRLFGLKAGFFVIFFDMLKIVIPFYSFWAILAFSGVNSSYNVFDSGVTYLWLVILFGAIGHCWPLYLHFKGGKAVSCFYAGFGGSSWSSFIFGLVSFLGILKSKKMVSYTSIFGSGIAVLFTWIMATIQYLLPSWNSGICFWNFGIGGLLYYGFEEATCLTLVFVLIVIRHRQNIQRLKQGTESKINWMK